MVYSTSPLAVSPMMLHSLESYLLFKGSEISGLFNFKSYRSKVKDFPSCRPLALALADIEPDFTLTNALYDNIELNWRNPPAQRFIDREVVAVVHGWITSSGREPIFSSDKTFFRCRLDAGS